MTLDADALDHLAHLARLALTPQERERMAEELVAVFTLLDRLAAVSTDGVEPMAHPLATMQPLRADIVAESDCRDALLALAPAAEAGLYLVPKVIE
ncbi:MAG: Asp-tRNA(Asn)/Glu-tRNA(Gln) amidotransferase subunit GatC [Hydrogenophilus sp.]|nr:Asp-tRNA(Asn)/Glu-tRNA(Gln) amidotransferase subunit GatC [Hydrogenophilus sp.]